jgi:hypothetical protein
MKIAIRLNIPLWKHSGPGAWYFISLSAELSEEIRSQAKHL